jgi:hypothetical protein
VVKKQLIIFFLIIIAALFVNYSNQLYVALPILIFLSLLNPKGLKIFLNWKVILFLIIVLFIVPLLALKKNTEVFSIPYSKQFFMISTVMVWRGIIIILALKNFTSRISIDELAEELYKIKKHNFGESLATALKVLPEIKIVVKKTFEEWKKSKKKYSPENIVETLVTLFVKIILKSEEYHSQNHIQTHEQ